MARWGRDEEKQMGIYKYVIYKISMNVVDIIA
jgi:hypothetical protein